MTIVPERTLLTAPYWEAAERGELLLQRCAECAEHVHPPAPSCPMCTHGRLEWVPAAGSGVVHSFTIARHAAHPAVKDCLPYVVALVRLDEGPRVVLNVLGVEPEQVVIGMRVRLGLGPTPGGCGLVQAWASSSG
jgi:uncharacterized OB-fold protein